MNQEEAKLQAYFFTEFGVRFPDIVAFAIPNGGKRDLKTAAKLKRTGVLKGVWDIFIAYPHATFNGIFIEMKAHSGGLTAEQKQFKSLLAPNYRFFIISTKDEIGEFMHWLKKFVIKFDKLFLLLYALLNTINERSPCQQLSIHSFLKIQF